MTVHYTEDHEWVKAEGDVFVIGISAHAAEQLGDVVFVELPEAGKSFAKGDEMAVVESVKAASDVYAPISGEVVEVNAAIVDDPSQVNADPAGAAWFVKIKPSKPAELDALMDEAAYKEFSGAAGARTTETTARGPAPRRAFHWASQWALPWAPPSASRLIIWRSALASASR